MWLKQCDRDKKTSRALLVFGGVLGRFPVFKVKELIRDVLAAHLADVQYHIDHSSKMTSTIADAIKNELKKLDLDRWVGWCFLGARVGDAYSFLFGRPSQGGACAQWVGDDGW